MQALQDTLGSTLPGIVGALLILVIGWLVAVVVRAGIKRGLGALKLNDRVSQQTESRMDLESGLAVTVFWIIIAFVLIGVFNALDLQAFSRPLDALVTQITGFLPNIIAAGVLAIVAWVIATIVRSLISKGLSATTLDEKLATDAGMTPMSSNIANIGFWLIILLFLPMILGVLGLRGLLEPVQAMIDKFLAALPNIFAAAVIGFVGWFIAKILKEIVANLLASAGADKLWDKAGIVTSTKLSSLLGTLVFVFVFIPALIAALETLNIEVISRPATEMLGMFLAAIPNILAAAIILAVTYFVAKFVVGLLTGLLSDVGFNDWPAKLGLTALAQGETKLSTMAGRVVMFFAMLFASVEAANRLGFVQVRNVVTIFIEFGGHILLGAVILAVGFWLANLAHKGIIQFGGKDQTGTANIARFAVLALVLAMGLRAMGIADDIVNLAFGLTLGAIAVAVALSFGLGGREAAGKQMEHWLRQIRKE